MVNVKLTREQNAIVRKLIESECSAYKNWIVSAVEASIHSNGKIEYARQLVKELREREAMYHIFVPDGLVKEG